MSNGWPIHGAKTGYKVQSSEQSAQQSSGKSERPWWQFKPGQSGNPSGKSRAQRRTAELTVEFERIRGRRPSTADLADLISAGQLMARLEDRRLDATKAAHASNSLQRVLRKLGLGTPPEPPLGAAELPMPSNYKIGERT